MTHPAYRRLVDRLNRFPQGAPSSEELYKILQILFSQREAEIVAQLPAKPFTTEKAARIWQVDVVSARKTLEDLASRALLIDVEKDGEFIYALPPPMAGFFEFSLMRVRDDIDQKALAELYYEYCTLDERFMDALVNWGETQLGRIYVHEPVVPPDAYVLDYERASEIIRTASHIGVSTCYCRKKSAYVGHVCDAPQEICMTLNSVAASLIRHDHARQVDVAEGLDVLQTAYDNNLVQFGENSQHGVSFICNCCGCCCEAMIAARRFGMGRTIHTNFMPTIDAEDCNGCGKCVNVCPVEAMTLVSANDPRYRKKKKAWLNEEICLGCGVCARACERNCIQMCSRLDRIIPPYNGTHRVLSMAIERDGLHNLLFDNRVLFSHRLMATVLGVLLKLPPLKRVLASKQVKSRFLEKILSRVA